MPGTRCLWHVACGSRPRAPVTLEVCEPQPRVPDASARDGVNFRRPSPGTPVSGDGASGFSLSLVPPDGLCWSGPRGLACQTPAGTTTNTARAGGRRLATRNARLFRDAHVSAVHGRRHFPPGATVPVETHEARALVGPKTRRGAHVSCPDLRAQLRLLRPVSHRMLNAEEKTLRAFGEHVAATSAMRGSAAGSPLSCGS